MTPAIRSEAPSIKTRQITHALWYERELEDAFKALEGAEITLVLVEALSDFIERSTASYKLLLEAVALLSTSAHPMAREALFDALDHPLVKVKRAVIDALAAYPELPWRQLSEKLATEHSHHVRVGLVELLANAPGATRWDILIGCDDPHWRVRKQVLTNLQRFAGEDGVEETRAILVSELERRGLDNDLSRGVIAYYDLYHSPQSSIEDCAPEAHGLALATSLEQRPWWSEEPSLVKTNLKAMTRDEMKREDIWLAWMLSHPAEKIRSIIITELASGISIEATLSFLIMASEPRFPGMDETREKLLARVRHDTLEACAWTILEHLENGIPLWEPAGIGEVAVNERWLKTWALSWLAKHIRPSDELWASPTWTEALEDCVASDAASARVCALEVAQQLSQDLSEDMLLSSFRHPDVRVANAAVVYLTEATWKQPSRDILDALIEAPHQDDTRFRAASACALVERALITHADAIERLANDPSHRVREACARALANVEDIDRASATLLGKLQHDPVARVREAAMTPEHARALLDDPVKESSWRVLERAADLCMLRLVRSLPDAWSQPIEVNLDEDTSPNADHVSVANHGEATLEEALEKTGAFTGSDTGEWWELVPLGNTSLSVSRMGISGHYALPERGFAEALDRGINHYFWEPIYLSQSRFFKPLSKDRKAGLVMCAGTFESTARGLRRDIERALRSMALEQIQVFYIFWIRDRARFTHELLMEMERCKEKGLVHTFGVSTHSRSLAREFLDEWPAVMVRHNAAHTGVEREVLPHVDRNKVGLITFSNLCYGRMVSELPGWDKGIPSAADAYRYSLSQEGVTGCWSAPSTIAQLRENLSALTRGPMSPEELGALRAYGRELYRLNTGFNRFIRNR